MQPKITSETIIYTLALIGTFIGSNMLLIAVNNLLRVDLIFYVIVAIIILLPSAFFTSQKFGSKIEISGIVEDPATLPTLQEILPLLNNIYYYVYQKEEVDKVQSDQTKLISENISSLKENISILEKELSEISYLLPLPLVDDSSSESNQENNFITTKKDPEKSISVPRPSVRYVTLANSNLSLEPKSLREKSLKGISKKDQQLLEKFESIPIKDLKKVLRKKKISFSKCKNKIDYIHILHEHKIDLFEQSIAQISSEVT